MSQRKNFAQHEERYLKTVIIECGDKGLSVNEGNSLLREAGISEKGHAKQLYGKLALSDNQGETENNFSVIDNRIYYTGGRHQTK